MVGKKNSFLTCLIFEISVHGFWFGFGIEQQGWHIGGPPKNSKMQRKERTKKQVRQTFAVENDTGESGARTGWCRVLV